MLVAVTGASGFIGTALLGALRRDGHTALAIGRAGSNAIPWNPDEARLDGASLEDVDAVVHLAGAPIGERWTAARKVAIRESRVRGTQLIARTIAALPPGRRPRVLVCASGVGFYGSRGDEWLDETSTPGTDFLATVARDWEAAAEPARTAGIRVVHLRNGLVLSPRGGALAKMLPPFRLGAGARLGNGRQWMSWIALDDVVRALQFALITDTLAGAANAVSPAPVTNGEFTATLAQVLDRPALATIPQFVLRALFGEMGEATLLASQRVRPVRLAAAGFEWLHPALADALRFELQR
ncbi:MAG TPA: TIGR01777 family oxidoreductase [Gemmatimonadaceae bacterium]|nr:TIGR01777 family oxidoreductase [Gemmatimonadaceae bacterium]